MRVSTYRFFEKLWNKTIPYSIPVIVCQESVCQSVAIRLFFYFKLQSSKTFELFFSTIRNKILWKFTFGEIKLLIHEYKLKVWKSSIYILNDSKKHIAHAWNQARVKYFKKYIFSFDIIYKFNISHQTSLLFNIMKKIVDNQY